MSDRPVKKGPHNIRGGGPGQGRGGGPGHGRGIRSKKPMIQIQVMPKGGGQGPRKGGGPGRR